MARRAFLRPSQATTAGTLALAPLGRRGPALPSCHRRGVVARGECGYTALFPGEAAASLCAPPRETQTRVEEPEGGNTMALMFINGESVPAKSGKTYEVKNPATGEVVDSVAKGGAEDVDAAVAAAEAAFPAW